MAFIGLVGAPYTFAEWQALKSAGTAAAEIATAAEETAVAAMLAEPALFVGAFLGGYAIGSEILRRLNRTETMPPLIPSYVGGEAGKSYAITVQYKLKNGPVQTGTLVQPGPIGPMSYDNPSPNTVRYFIPNGGGVQYYLSANPDDIEEAPTVIAGQEVGTGKQLKGVPSFPPAKPQLVPYAPTVPINVPGYPVPIEITPTVIPNPANDPDTPEEERVPGGVLVKIPEAGQMVQFTPTGVQITNYKPPITETQPAPQKPQIKPPVKVPTDPCPCPEPKVDLKEVLCRLKALEKGLLSDGFQYTVNSGPSGQGGVKSDIQDELVYVSLQINAFSNKERTQRAAPGTPTVYFIGWFSWIAGNFPSERMPISYLNHNFIAPSNATGYLFSLHDGASAISSYTVRKPKDYIDLC